MDTDKTIISFRFKKPGAFSITGFGNMNPKIIPVLDKSAPAAFGNVWVQGYDFEEVIKLELPNENVRELPAHINKSADHAVRIAYQRKSAEDAAAQHNKNNEIRTELKHHIGTGLIEIVGDSFFDEASPEGKVTVPTE